MTMFRSQTDEMLAAKFDPEPWVANGNRYPVERHRAFGVATFDPRPEFIPTEFEVVLWDGRTLGRYDNWDDANSASTWYTGSYVRSARPEPNPILVWFRREHSDVKPWLADRWARIAELGQVPWAVEGDATPEHIRHARKVLTRLAALS